MSPARWTVVSFPEVGATVTAEWAADRRGLMGRRALPEGQGMLFDMGRNADHGVYMKNTLIPLDMIFISAAGVVVGIVECARPLDETLRTVGVSSRYVLEVNGGWCRRHGVRVGHCWRSV